MNRRNLIRNLSLSGLAFTSFNVFRAPLGYTPTDNSNSRIKHSVCRWTYNFLTLDELCETVNTLGFSAIDLVGPKDWPTLKKYSVHSSMCNGAEISLTEGWNNKQNHPTLLKNYQTHIDLVAAAGYTNLICFSGNRKGMDDETGLLNCAEGLKKLMSQAEKRGVIIHMELLNSKVDHKDYMCDHSTWGVELCKRINSPNFRLLYDIYHMQINEGDVIRTIQNNHDFIGHYHTAGVPGRHEIDESQELYYPAIMKAIADTGFTGYIAQEFSPTGKDSAAKIAALKKAIQICSV